MPDSPARLLAVAPNVDDVCGTSGKLHALTFSGPVRMLGSARVAASANVEEGNLAACRIVGFRNMNFDSSRLALHDCCVKLAVFLPKGILPGYELAVKADWQVLDLNSAGQNYPTDVSQFALQERQCSPYNRHRVHRVS